MKNNLMVTVSASLVIAALSFSPIAMAKHKGHQYEHERFDYAKVTKVRPIYETVRYSYPEESCHIEKRRVRNSRDASSAIILGSIIGGAIGKEIGHNKHNKKLRTIAGALLGGSIAKEIQDKKHGYRYSNEEVCTQTYRVEHKDELVGYDVTYRYHGNIYTTVTEEHPGKRIQVATRVRPLLGAVYFSR